MNMILKGLIGLLLLALVIVGCDNIATGKKLLRQRAAYADTVTTLRRKVDRLEAEKASIKVLYYEAQQKHQAQLDKIDSTVARLPVSASRDAVLRGLSKLGLLR